MFPGVFSTCADSVSKNPYIRSVGRTRANGRGRQRPDADAPRESDAPIRPGRLADWAPRTGARTMPWEGPGCGRPFASGATPPVRAVSRSHRERNRPGRRWPGSHGPSSPAVRSVPLPARSTPAKGASDLPLRSGRFVDRLGLAAVSTKRAESGLGARMRLPRSRGQVNAFGFHDVCAVESLGAGAAGAAAIARDARRAHHPRGPLATRRDAGRGQFRVYPGRAVRPAAAGVNRLHAGPQLGIRPRRATRTRWCRQICRSSAPAPSGRARERVPPPGPSSGVSASASRGSAATPRTGASVPPPSTITATQPQAARFVKGESASVARWSCSG